MNYKRFWLQLAAIFISGSSLISTASQSQTEAYLKVPELNKEASFYRTSSIGTHLKSQIDNILAREKL